MTASRAINPNQVERRTIFTDANGVVAVKASRGFRSESEQYVPQGCPPEFAAMILAAVTGDTSLIKRSFDLHPERRIIEQRSSRVLRHRLSGMPTREECEQVVRNAHSRIEHELRTAQAARKKRMMDILLS